MVSAWRDFMPNGTFGKVWRHFVTSLNGGGRVSLVSSLLMLKVLTNILQCIGQRLQQRITQSEMATAPRLRNPGLNYGDVQEGGQLPNRFWDVPLLTLLTKNLSSFFKYCYMILLWVPILKKRAFYFVK